MVGSAADGPERWGHRVDGEVPMNRSWKSQIVEGRVFELRSKSKRYPAPCALVINDKANGWGNPIFAPVDKQGVIGLSYPRGNPNIYIGGIRREEFTSSRVLRRRRDLERFDADDLALIRYGLTIDFTGHITGTYSDMHIPTVIPAEWTVFWLSAWDDGDFTYGYDHHIKPLLSGAWNFYSHGGARRLGYRFGCLWGTRHTGKRLNEIRKFLRSHYSGLMEMPVKISRYKDGDKIYTEEVRRDCPALGSRWCTVESLNGNSTSIVGICR